MYVCVLRVLLSNVVYVLYITFNVLADEKKSWYIIANDWFYEFIAAAVEI